MVKESNEYALAPIILFAYNRPVHVRRTVESLLANGLASQSSVIAFCDGPRSAFDEPAVNAVRTYLKTVVGFKSIKVVERDRNHGLANSVIGGISEVLETSERVIVVEDDLLLSPVFLKYMNDALERYATMDRVMHIAAYMYPIDSAGLPQTFFFRAASCWGWGTWRRAWCRFEHNTQILTKQFDASARYRFNVDGAYSFWQHFARQQQGKVDSWAIRWYASIFLNGGLCLHPCVSLVRNAGSDGSGTHSEVTQMFDGNLRQTEITEFESDVNENPLALQRIVRFLQMTQPSLSKRILRRVLGIAGVGRPVG